MDPTDSARVPPCFSPDLHPATDSAHCPSRPSATLQRRRKGIEAPGPRLHGAFGISIMSGSRGHRFALSIIPDEAKDFSRPMHRPIAHVSYDLHRIPTKPPTVMPVHHVRASQGDGRRGTRHLSPRRMFQSLCSRFFHLFLSPPPARRPRSLSSTPSCSTCLCLAAFKCPGGIQSLLTSSVIFENHILCLLARPRPSKPLF